MALSRALIDGTVLRSEPQRRKDAAGAVATLDLGAVRRNYRAGLRTLGEGVTPAAVLKANGYGLGATRLAKVLIEEGCRDFFVARINEGADLRKALRAERAELADEVAINVLDGNLAGSDPRWLVEHELTPVLASLAQVRAWNRTGQAQKRRLPAILQVDIRKNRFGMPTADLLALLPLLGGREPQLNHVTLQFVMSGEPHLGTARMVGIRHDLTSCEVGGHVLEQELTLQSKIAQVRELSPSDAIGYGSRYVADQPMRVATILAGYADGLPRIGGGNRPVDAPTEAYVLVDGKHKAPLVGTTSMDLTTIDVSAVPPEALRPGTPVTVIGGDITTERLGQMYRTSACEVQTKLTGRVHRVVRDEAGPPPAEAPLASAHLWDYKPARGATAPSSLRRQAIENLRTERLKKNTAGAVLKLNLGAVRRNYRAGLKKLGDGVTPAAVLKANGYGLGATRLAKVLIEEGCRDFFVARINEGVDLRKALRAERPELADKVAINVLDGNLPGSDPQWLVEHRLTPVLNSLEQVQAWNEAGRAQARQLPAILQVDTGMNRSGMSAADLQALLALPKGHEQHPGHVKLQFIMSHLANACEVTPGPDGTLQPGEATRRQLSRFEDICKRFPGAKASIGASSTVYLGAELQKDMVRMGGTFHGQAPFDADSNPLEQVLTLKSRIAQVRELSPSEAKRHGLEPTTDQPVRVATLPIGYADGPPRVGGATPTQAYVLVGGKHKAPLVGAMSMDQTLINVSAVPPEALRPGTSVTVIGDGLTTDHMGQMYGSSASETQSKLTGRVHKVVIDDDKSPAADTRRASANLWSLLRG